MPLALTARFARCTTCLTDPRTFRKDGATALLNPWCPPRGWAGTTRVGSRTLMAVTLNPGAPMTDERALYGEWGLTSPGHVTPLQAQNLLAHCTSQYVNPGEGQDTVFHRKVVTFARTTLWLFGKRDTIQSSTWIDDCWFTDLFKCSTRAESAPVIPSAALAACEAHFWEELDAFSPSVVLTFGKGADKAMARLSKSRQTPPHFAFAFPVNAGLPPVTSRAHDERFDEIAEAAQLVWSSELRAEFNSFREALHHRYFA